VRKNKPKKVRIFFHLACARMSEIYTHEAPTQVKAPAKAHVHGLPGTFTGWHHYGFNEERFPCIGDPCMMVDKHRNNYWRCEPCSMVEWFNSKITTFQGDDKERACAMVRLGAREPLQVHTKVREAFNAFRGRGGQVHVLALKRDLPTILQLNARTCSVTYPAHLPTNCLRGTARAKERANALAIVVPNPWDAEAQEE
jgi:hypothetical protein